MTEPCPIGLDCLIFGSECGYPGWTESQCITWLLCKECSKKEENEQLKEEIVRLQSVFIQERDCDRLQQALMVLYEP